MAPTVWMLDYGAGNVRSLLNAVHQLGHQIEVIRTADDIANASVLIFPGVGAFSSAMSSLDRLGLTQALKDYLASGRPYLGICIGMQVLFDGSEEAPGVAGLGFIPGTLARFPEEKDIAVPQIGWNGYRLHQACAILPNQTPEQYYFVHSYMMPWNDSSDSQWAVSVTDYGVPFVSSIGQGSVFGTQFHPEKSGQAGLRLLSRFLLGNLDVGFAPIEPVISDLTMITKRIVACLDVRANDKGELVVTKGDQYNVREEGAVRNLGQPLLLAEEYYRHGADEIVFLNITSFRDCPLKDLPMLELVRKTAEKVFVPLTIGGGVRDITENDGTVHTALDVATEYFRAGADKVSIGSDAVYSAEEYYANGQKVTGKSSIEQIASIYGSQAVVVSVDPKRVYVESADCAAGKHVIKTSYPGPNGERYCWYQCTVKGGREARPLDAYHMVRACQALGAGEILLNCIDKDGSNGGFDIELIADIKAAVTVPVIASSGAGSAQHFVDVFDKAHADAALAAGIFHRGEISITAVKKLLTEKNIPCRL